jgi:hypothetical protein
MTTATLRIEDKPEFCVAEAAQRAGKTPHTFKLDAFAETVDQLELCNEIHRVADERWAELMTTGKSIGWDQAKL